MRFDVVGTHTGELWRNYMCIYNIILRARRRALLWRQRGAAGVAMPARVRAVAVTGSADAVTGSAATMI